jgi:hypothetical protein
VDVMVASDAVGMGLNLYVAVRSLRIFTRALN